jgi:intracellular multiplication protein IcmC
MFGFGSATGAISGLAGIHFTTFLQHLVQSVPNVMKLITGMMFLAGMVFIFKGLYAFKQYGEMRTMMSVNANLRAPIVYIVVGAALLATPSLLSVSLNTLYGPGAQIMTYAQSGLANSFSKNTAQDIKDGARVLQVVGYIAFFRGWILVSRLAGQNNQPGTLGKALSHIIGGLLLINIFGSWYIIKNTLGIIST